MKMKKKIFLLPIAVALTAFFACNNGKKAEATASGTVAFAKDTVRITEVDTFLERTFRAFQGTPHSLTPFHFNGKTDSLVYYDLPGGQQVWDAKVSIEATESYVTLLLQNEEPWYFRFREWNQAKDMAIEIIIYFKNGEIFYAKDRRTEPGSKMNPSHLLQMPHFDSKMSKEELAALFNRYYPPMKEAWDTRVKPK